MLRDFDNRELRRTDIMQNGFFFLAPRLFFSLDLLRPSILCFIARCIIRIFVRLARLKNCKKQIISKRDNLYSTTHRYSSSGIFIMVALQIRDRILGILFSYSMVPGKYLQRSRLFTPASKAALMEYVES